VDCGVFPPPKKHLQSSNNPSLSKSYYLQLTANKQGTSIDLACDKYPLPNGLHRIVLNCHPTGARITEWDTRRRAPQPPREQPADIEAWKTSDLENLPKSNNTDGDDNNKFNITEAGSDSGENNSQENVNDNNNETGSSEENKTDDEQKPKIKMIQYKNQTHTLPIGTYPLYDRKKRKFVSISNVIFFPELNTYYNATNLAIIGSKVPNQNGGLSALLSDTYKYE